MLRVLLYLLLFTSLLQAQQGIINGRIEDAKTGESLIGANIIVNELENVGAASDENGRFSFNVPVGSYSVKVSLIGYQTIVKVDVIVKSGSETNLTIKLSETALEMGEVKVTADYFDQAIIENTLSTVVLGAEEVRRSPGSMQDFQRILQAMPGVSFSDDQTNELLVRGGSPNENLTVFDNMEIHSTNHYPNSFNSGGPINMINVDLIEDIQFSTGGFISKYGDKLSSVMNLTSREGTRNRMWSGNFNLSMAGAGLIGEGQIDDGRGSWIISGRKSYIDLIAGSFGLTAIPHYYDFQFKVAYDLSEKHKLSLSGIYGNDAIDITGEPEITNLELANKSDTVDVENVDVKQDQYAAGITLKSIWSKNFFSLVTLSKNNYNEDIFVTYDFTERFYDGNGEVFNTEKLSKRKVYSRKVDNGETALKTDFVFSPAKWYEMSFGGALKFIQYTAKIESDADTVRYDINDDGAFGINDPVIILDPMSVDYKFDFFEENKNYFYLNNKFSFFEGRLIVNAGLRYDHFTYSEMRHLSPRFSASWYLIPLVTKLNFSYGEYYQTQALPDYGDRYQSEINRYLANTHSRHFVAGIDHILGEGLKLTLETYYKNYSQIPYSETFIHYYDRTLRSEKKLSVGEKEAWGIDFLLQQKLVDDIYGTLSFSRMWTKAEDPRSGYEGKSFVSDFDFPYVLNLIVGKRFTDLRSKLNKMNPVIKYMTMVLPFSDDMEISLRWRYASGKPYTPREFRTNEQHREGHIQWGKGSWVATDAINSARYPDYHRLDVALNSRYNFDNWSLVLFLSVQNLYNRENIAYYQYNSDGTRENVYQFSLLPVGGFEIEF